MQTPQKHTHPVSCPSGNWNSWVYGVTVSGQYFGLQGELRIPSRPLKMLYVEFTTKRWTGTISTALLPAVPQSFHPVCCTSFSTSLSPWIVFLYPGEMVLTGVHVIYSFFRCYCFSSACVCMTRNSRLGNKAVQFSTLNHYALLVRFCSIVFGVQKAVSSSLFVMYFAAHLHRPPAIDEQACLNHTWTFRHGPN